MGKIWIAGPCAAETREQVLTTATQLVEQARSANLRLHYFRAGAWKVRSAPTALPARVRRPCLG